jgi:hypothetical protein
MYATTREDFRAYRVSAIDIERLPQAVFSCVRACQTGQD